MVVIKIFKGYLKTSGKKSVQKFKDDESNLVTFNTARRYESFGAVLKEEVLFLDIDSKGESELLLKIVDDLDMNVNVLKTDQGAHFYFRRPDDVDKNRINWFSPLGIQVTVKVGISNVVEPLKIDGETRRWIRKADGELDYLPKWLYPTSRKENGLSKLEDGDGRNQELFNYILKLQSVGMNKEEIRETIRLINKFVLREPLEKSEIETILRDEAFMKESFFVGNKFQFDKFGDFLIHEHFVIRIGEQLHIFKDGVYLNNESEIERIMLKNINNLSSMQRREVLSYLRLKAPDRELSDHKFIVLKDCVINLDNMESEEFNPRYIIKNKIPTRYNQLAYSKILDKTLNKIACNDKQTRSLIEEVMGYTLLRSNRFTKTIIFTGEGSNGKSTLFALISKMIGEENISNIQLKDLDKRFKTAELFGKLANIGDDISKETIQDNSVFKMLSTGGVLDAERKNGDPFSFKNYSTLIYGCNGIPMIKDNSNGLMRRLLLIPLRAEFKETDDDFDPNIEDHLTELTSIQYLLQLSLKGLERLMLNKGFSQSDYVKEQLETYEEQNNTILAFIKHNEPKLENEPTSSIYQQYLVWCVDYGVEAVSQIEFSREVCKREVLTTRQVRVNGKRKYVFSRKKK